MQRLVRSRVADQRETFRVLDGFERKVNSEVWPIEVMGMKQFDVQKFADRRILEPRKVSEGEEQLPVPNQEPEAVLRHVPDFNV